jgi:hypothetical protein
MIVCGRVLLSIQCDSQRQQAAVLLLLLLAFDAITSILLLLRSLAIADTDTAIM